MGGGGGTSINLLYAFTLINKIYTQHTLAYSGEKIEFCDIRTYKKCFKETQPQKTNFLFTYSLCSILSEYEIDHVSFSLPREWP